MPRRDATQHGVPYVRAICSRSQPSRNRCPFRDSISSGQSASRGTLATVSFTAMSPSGSGSRTYQGRIRRAIDREAGLHSGAAHARPPPCHDPRMRHNALHASDDPEVVRQLIREHPWGTLVSHHDGRLAASHYPILLDEDHPELAVVTHVGRPDERNHAFGESEMLLIVQGRHGYISPSWYAPGESQAPTWNFTTAHCYGVAQVLDPEENLAVLTQLVAHFERHVDDPLYLDQEYGR